MDLKDLEIPDWEKELTENAPVGKFQKDMYILYMLAQGHELKKISVTLGVTKEYIKKLRDANKDKIKEFQGYIVKETIFEYTKLIKTALQRAQQMLLDDSVDIKLNDITKFLELLFEKRAIQEALTVANIQKMGGERAIIERNEELKKLLPRYSSREVVVEDAENV